MGDKGMPGRGMEALSVLIAYDVHHTLEALCTHLEASGCRVTRAVGHSAEEILLLLSQQVFDVVMVSGHMEPDHRHLVVKRAKHRNPDTVIVLIGSRQQPEFDHDTVSFRGWDYVLAPSGRPDLWPSVTEFLERAELEQRDAHARDLIGKFRQQISTISESISTHIGLELRRILQDVKRLRAGELGPLPPPAAFLLEALSERMSQLVHETDMLSKGFVPRPLPSEPPPE